MLLWYGIPVLFIMFCFAVAFTSYAFWTDRIFSTIGWNWAWLAVPFFLSALFVFFGGDRYKKGIIFWPIGILFFLNGHVMVIIVLLTGLVFVAASALFKLMEWVGNGKATGGVGVLLAVIGFAFETYQVVILERTVLPREAILYWTLCVVAWIVFVMLGVLMVLHIRKSDVEDREQAARIAKASRRGHTKSMSKASSNSPK